MKSRSICPSCKAVLEFDRAVISMVKCPKCHYAGKVEIFKKLEPGTFIPGNKTGQFSKPGNLEFLESDVEWLQTEKTVDLQIGINTLGRKSPNSTGNFQLPVEDLFMSKEHAVIDVVMKTDGVFEHRLWDKGSRNGTFHNEERLENGDVIKLIKGDIIKLGHTVLKFSVE